MARPKKTGQEQLLEYVDSAVRPVWIGCQALERFAATLPEEEQLTAEENESLERALSTSRRLVRRARKHALRIVEGGEDDLHSLALRTRMKSKAEFERDVENAARMERERRLMALACAELLFAPSDWLGCPARDVSVHAERVRTLLRSPTTRSSRRELVTLVTLGCGVHLSRRPESEMERLRQPLVRGLLILLAALPSPDVVVFRSFATLLANAARRLSQLAKKAESNQSIGLRTLSGLLRFYEIADDLEQLDEEMRACFLPSVAEHGARHGGRRGDPVRAEFYQVLTEGGLSERQIAEHVLTIPKSGLRTATEEIRGLLNHYRSRAVGGVFVGDTLSPQERKRAIDEERRAPKAPPYLG